MVAVCYYIKSVIVAENIFFSLLNLELVYYSFLWTVILMIKYSGTWTHLIGLLIISLDQFKPNIPRGEVDLNPFENVTNIVTSWLIIMGHLFHMLRWLLDLTLGVYLHEQQDECRVLCKICLRFWTTRDNPCCLEHMRSPPVFCWCLFFSVYSFLLCFLYFVRFLATRLFSTYEFDYPFWYVLPLFEQTIE